MLNFLGVFLYIGHAAQLVHLFICLLCFIMLLYLLLQLIEYLPGFPLEQFLVHLGIHLRWGLGLGFLPLFPSFFDVLQKLSSPFRGIPFFLLLFHEFFPVKLYLYLLHFLLFYLLLLNELLTCLITMFFLLPNIFLDLVPIGRLIVYISRDIFGLCI